MLECGAACRPNMKLKIIFNSISILTHSRNMATTKVTAICDKRTLGDEGAEPFQNGTAVAPVAHC